MGNKSLSSLHTVSIIFMFNITSIVVFGGFNKSGSLFFITPVIAGFIGLFYAYLLYYFNKKYPSLSFYQLSEKLTGKVFGTVISSVYLCFSVYITMRVLKNSALVIHKVSLNKTPETVIMACIALLALYGVNSGKTAIIRLSVISLVITAVTLLFSFVFNIENISPDFLAKDSSFNTENTVIDTLNYLILPFSECILLYGFVSKAKAKNFCPVAISVLMSGFTLGLVGFTMCGVLGINNVKEQMYPFYSTISVLSVGKSFSRIEIIVGATMIYSLIIKLIVCVTCIKDYISYYIGEKYEMIITSALMGAIVITGVFFTGEKYHVSRIINEYLTAAPIITFGIPLILLPAELKKTKNQRIYPKSVDL